MSFCHDSTERALIQYPFLRSIGGSLKGEDEGGSLDWSFRFRFRFRLPLESPRFLRGFIAAGYFGHNP